MNAAPNGNTHPAPGAPAHVATIEGAIDSWAVMSFDAGTYSPEAHAAVTADLLARTVQIPVLGEIGPDGRITWYGKPPTRQAE